MTELSVGISLHLPVGPADRPAMIEPLLDAIESKAWSKPLRNFTSNSEGGRPFPRRAGIIHFTERRSVLREQLVHPDVGSFWLGSVPPTRSGKEVACIDVNIRKMPWDEHVLLAGRQWISDSTAADTWVAAMLRMAEAIGAEHGVVPVMASGETFSECWLFILSRDGVEQHPFPDQLHRMLGHARPHLSDRYVRFPRWGTIYARHHVDALGGIDRIRESVQPAVIREFGPNAWYVQLTASIATALSAEALERQQRFTAIADPLLPPPRAAEY